MEVHVGEQSLALGYLLINSLFLFLSLLSIMLKTYGSGILAW